MILMLRNGMHRHDLTASVVVLWNGMYYWNTVLDEGKLEENKKEYRDSVTSS